MSNNVSSPWLVERYSDRAVLVRGSGAAEPGPEDWKQRLSSFLDTAPGIGIVGAKRLTADGQHVFAMGEFVVHPKGFHHLGKDTASICYRFPEETDVVAGGVVAVDRKLFEEVDGPAILARGVLGLVELGLTLRRRGLRCVTIPQVSLIDPTTPQPTAEEWSAFRGRWGFDWIAADLDEVRAKHAGTGLFWNVRHHAGQMPFDRYDYRPTPVWKSYADHDFFRKRADYLADLAQRFGQPGPILEIGCGDGLFTHLIALRNVAIIGLDREAHGITQAQGMTAPHSYPGPRPTYQVGDGAKLDFPDAHFAEVALFDVIEHLPNPVEVLREIKRVLKPGGHALFVTPGWQYGTSSDPVYHGHEYTMEELARQVVAGGGFTVVSTSRITGIYRDLVLVAKK